MSTKFLLYSIIFAAISISGCTGLNGELKQEKLSGGAINIYINTHAKNQQAVNLYVDNVRVDMETLRAVVGRSKEIKRMKPTHQIFGTF